MTAPRSARFAGLGKDTGPDPATVGADLARLIEERFLDRLRSRERPTSARTNRASSLGDPCLRRLVLRRTAGEQERPVDDMGLSIFNLGNMLEGPIRRLVEELGFEVEKSQMSFPPNDFNVSGHIDGVIRHPRYRVRAILEIKGVNGQTWKGLRTVEDIREHAKSWVAKWGAQATLYPVMAQILGWGDHEEEKFPIAGTVFVLLNKWTGEIRSIFVPLDYTEGEKLLDKSMAIEAHVSAKTFPDFIEDKGECLTCPFRPHACNPDMAVNRPLQVITDPDVLAALETRDNAAGAAKDFKEADEYLFGSDASGVLRGIGLAIVPNPEADFDFHVRGAWSPSTTYTIPAEVKAPYKESNPQGTWRKTVEKVRREP